MTAAIAPRSTTITLASVDKAIASQDWQSAYDAAMNVKLGSEGGLERLLDVSAKLHLGGASEASLDILNRGIDVYAGDPELYFQLVHVLTELDRLDDAQVALDLLKASTSVA
jgi:hypothetical protein